MVNSATAAAAVVTCGLSGGVAGRRDTAAAGAARIEADPATMTRISGTSFSTVVTTCTRPPLRTPSTLTPTKNHTNPTASTAGSRVPAAGKTTTKYPTAPMASTALLTHTEIQ